MNVVFSVLVTLALGQSADAPEIGGISVALAKEEDGRFIIRKILDEGAAAASGALAVGDEIISISSGNEKPIDLVGLELQDVTKQVRGPIGTSVRLTIIPAGKDAKQAKTVSLVRGQIKALGYFGDDGLLDPGDKVPDVNFVAIDTRKSEKLDQFKGRLVVLDFWASWCGPCQEHVAHLESLVEEHPEWKDTVALVAVSIDDDADIAAKHLAAKGWNKAHHLWADGAAVKEFHISGVPTTYIIGSDGKIASSNQELSPEEVIGRLLKQ